MSPTDLAELLKLPPGERAELAIVLWESLTDEERADELALDQEGRAELDRRWTDHLGAPDAAISWDDLQRKLTSRA